MTKLEICLLLIAITRHVTSGAWLNWQFGTQVAAACFALLGQWLYGNRWRFAPAVGLTGQLVWHLMIWVNGAWGLLVSNVPMTIVQARNLRRWTR